MSLNDYYCLQNILRAGFYAGLTASLPVPSGADFISLFIIILVVYNPHQINKFFFFMLS